MRHASEPGATPRHRVPDRYRLDPRTRPGTRRVVDEQVTQKVESAVDGVEGIEGVQSTSSAGFSVVVIEFSLETDT